MSIDRNCNPELELTLWGESVQGRARSWIVYLWKVSLTLLQNVLVWDVCATGQRFRYYVVLIVISLGMS